MLAPTYLSHANLKVDLEIKFSLLVTLLFTIHFTTYLATTYPTPTYTSRQVLPDKSFDG